jgi:RNA polymerase sigma-70 factor (ECF subfamily)
MDLMEVDVPPPGAASDDRDRDRLVQECVDSLPPHLREILLLAYFQRMSYANISESLEVPLGTVKSRLHAAVAAFGRAWSLKYDPDRGPGGGSGNHDANEDSDEDRKSKRKRAGNG